MRELGGEIKRMEASWRRSRRAATSSRDALPNLPSPDAPDGEEGDGVTLREVGDVRDFGFEVRDHLDLGTQHGWIEMEKAAEASGSRFAYLIGDLVMVELALVRFAVERVRAEGFEPVVPPVLVREGRASGHRLLPWRAGDDLRGRARRALPGRHLGGARWPLSTPATSSRRPTCPSATRASRPAFAARPAPPARTRAASSASISSTRSRCSRSSCPPSRRPSTSGSSRSRRGSSRRSRSRTASSTSRSATSARPPRASSTARRGSPARSATASSPRARTRPTTRRAASARGSAPRPTPRPRCCTR